MGHLNLCPAGQLERVRLGAHSEYLVVQFTPALLSRACAAVPPAWIGEKDDGCVELLPRFQLRDPLLEQLARALWTQAARPETTADRFYVEALGTALGAHLLRHHCRPGIQAFTDLEQRRLGGNRAPQLSAGRLRLALDYLYGHLEDSPSLHELAQLVNLSPFHFARAFRGSTGLAPHQFLIQARVDRARDLLSKGGLPAGEVALRLGFADQSHFGRHFKRLTGLTPAEFARGGRR